MNALNLPSVFSSDHLTLGFSTADLFCSLLRDALKVELQRGRMKAVKGFVKTCYSEVLVSSPAPENEREDGSLMTTEEKDG